MLASDSKVLALKPLLRLNLILNLTQGEKEKNCKTKRKLVIIAMLRPLCSGDCFLGDSFIDQIQHQSLFH